MEVMMLHRGRLIDHLHLVVEDYPEALRFYSAVLQSLDVPIGGLDDYFWADELFVSTVGSEAAAGVPTGRHHLAFQASSREMVDAFHAAGLAAGGRDHGAPGTRPYHRSIMLASSWTRQETILKRCITVPQPAVLPR